LLITIPHMGNVYLAAKALFDGIDVPYVIPEPNNKESLQKGSLYSPEEMCLPFKLMMGNYMQSIEKGADTILITGSCGPCRYGEYCELQIKILSKLGHDLDFIVLDAPGEIGMDEFLRRLGKIFKASSKSRAEKLLAIKRAFRVMDSIEKLEAKAHYLAGYEINKGDCKRILRQCKKDAFGCDNPVEMLRVIKEYLKKINAVPVDKTKNPIKLSIIGEIYTVIEPYSNLNIEDKLMDYGVSTKRLLTPSWWYRDIVLKPLKLNSPGLRRASKEYLPLYIGGHGRECIGEAVLAHKEGMDGAIQIFPLGCMPEIVTKAILPSIQRDKNFPIMSLIVDEMTGEAGFMTRIEAFLDMIKSQKKQTDTNIRY
jgi:predicted nucleotide-binding protein (sugar kinase/HSP70/actin superfamily)